MPPTTSFKFGDVVLVSFPFTSQTGTKQRPAAVVSSAGYQKSRPDVILLAITSQVRSVPGFGEARVADWQGAGLLKPSVLKPVLLTAEKTLIRKTLGRLQAADEEALRRLLRVILG